MTQNSPQVPVKKSDNTKNQLTVIVILIIIVVTALAIALAFAAPSLSNFQKWVFFAALIFFPFVSIGAVTWLILRHSRKLIISSNDESMDWETTSPEMQKRKLNVEIRELSQLLDISSDQLTDLRSAFIVAEDLAMRKIQNETNVPMMRKVQIGKSDFDAVWIDKDLITCVELTFVVTPNVDQNKINRVMRKVASAKTTLESTRKGTRVRLLLVIVTQLDEKAEADLRSGIKKNFKSTPVDVDIRFLDFLTLQKLYAED
jgi:hypothetical protein